MESSPCPVFLLAVIDKGAVPAVGAANGGDDLLIFGRDKAEALSYLEVLGAAEVPDELLADIVLHAARHVEVEAGHAFFHDGPDVRTELLAVLASDLRIARVHGCLYERHGVGILSHEPVEALLLERTVFDETH